MPKILVVDDEIKILQVIEEHLTSEGFKVQTLEDPRAAAALALSGEFDLLVLDIMMPDQSGFEICKQVRQASSLPIVLLTARSDEIDKLIGLELGADDYITKPFSLRELTARVRAILRRVSKASSVDSELLKAGPITLNISRYEGWVNGEPLLLTPTEMKILHLLMSHPGQVFSRLQILEHAFGDAYEGYERTIDTHISNIRKKIDPHPLQSSWIKSVYGVGYKFAGERSGHDNA